MQKNLPAFAGKFEDFSEKFSDFFMKDYRFLYKVKSISKVPYAISREKKMLATNIRLRNVVLTI